MAYISIDKPSTILYWDGKLCEVGSIGEGKTIHLRVLRDSDKNHCPHCDGLLETEFDWLEHAPIFQDGVKPVNTITTPPKSTRERK